MVTGKITKSTEGNDKQLEQCNIPCCSRKIILNESDVYKELKLRGYKYRYIHLVTYWLQNWFKAKLFCSGLFQGIKASCGCLQSGLLKWQQNWVAYMENMLQLQVLHTNCRKLYIPTHIHRIAIDLQQHMKLSKSLEMVPLLFCPMSSLLR